MQLMGLYGLCATCHCISDWGDLSGSVGMEGDNVFTYGMVGMSEEEQKCGQTLI
jgi:hypothetical protein